MKILSRPKGAAEEYGRWSVNAYLGCPHGCAYCYLKRGPGSKTLGGSEAHLKAGVKSFEHAFYLAMAEIMEHREEIIRDGGLFMTFTSDPCTAKTAPLFLQIIHELKGVRQLEPIYTTLLTKDADQIFLHSNLLFTQEPWQVERVPNRNVAIGFTLTGHDELEPGASTNDERIDRMRELNESGLLTWASIEPVIDFKSSYDMIRKALDAGCRHFKIGLQTMNNHVIRRQYDHAECLAFVQDVMVATADRATVYWKKSVRDFIGGTPKHRLFTDDELHDILDRYPNSVDARYSMFANK